ncbi:hypothetical protein DUNSADRAFT_17858 [Dunaliella salina]|uniref:Uncharacterized protein n=1 Tax=Dunaliella salina TaxID=3046 RepID=A0ABQ7G0Z7_DUNSA|nr:hypothetical protein DUNSADRAFT_17858 [Dunaliella salina]|eukprot:KAF5828284.1 hypothetical protein DUNSADRAFT_17858 [Dunaliella salina]
MKQDQLDAQQTARLQAQEESQRVLEQQLRSSDERFTQVQKAQAADLARMQAEREEEMYTAKLQVQEAQARLAMQQKAQQVAEARASQWENRAKTLLSAQKGLEGRIQDVQAELRDLWGRDLRAGETEASALRKWASEMLKAREAAETELSLRAVPPQETLSRRAAFREGLAKQLGAGQQQEAELMPVRRDKVAATDDSAAAVSVEAAQQIASLLVEQANMRTEMEQMRKEDWEDREEEIQRLTRIYEERLAAQRLVLLEAQKTEMKAATEAMKGQLIRRNEQVGQLEDELLRLQGSLDDIKSSIASGLALAVPPSTPRATRAPPTVSSGAGGVDGSRGGSGGFAEAAKASRQGSTSTESGPAQQQRGGLLRFVRGIFGGKGSQGGNDDSGRSDGRAEERDGRDDDGEGGNRDRDGGGGNGGGNGKGGSGGGGGGRKGGGGGSGGNGEGPGSMTGRAMGTDVSTGPTGLQAPNTPSELGAGGKPRVDINSEIR